MKHYINLNLLFLLVGSIGYFYDDSVCHAAPTGLSGRAQTPLQGSNLHKEPTGANSMTVYRAVTDDELHQLERQMVTGGHPRSDSIKQTRGDFNTQNTQAFYMFNNLKNAQAWCQIRLKQGKKECKVARFSWHSPKGLKLKRWEEGNFEWKSYVRWNMDKENYHPGVKHQIQKDHDWIEGPMSMNDPKEGFVPDPDVSMQYCLLNPNYVSSLHFLQWHSADPTPDHELKKKKKRSPEPLPLPAASKKAPAKKPEKKAQEPPTKVKKLGVEKAPTALQTATALDVPTPTPTKNNAGLASELTGVVEFTALIQRLSKASMAQKDNDQ